MNADKKIEYWDIYDIHKQKTGKIIKRGDKLQDGEYHLFVQVWLVNHEGKFLSQERSEKIKWPLMWCASGGNAKCGEDGITCAIREIKEELDIDITKLNGALFDTRVYIEDNQNYFCDSFIFYCDRKLKDYYFQEEEIKSLDYKDVKEIRSLMKKGMFFTYDSDYLDILDQISKEIKEGNINFNKYKKEMKI